MKIECDSDKDQINRAKHDLSLAAGADMDFEAATIIADERHNYGEARYWAIGPIGAGCTFWPCGRSH
jgi:uncharacterized protein